MTESGVGEGRTRRPANRKEQIADAAAGLFRDAGYHNVGVHDIAGTVGITGRAIYRHFANKQELLTDVVLDGVEHLEAAVDGDDLTALVVDLASLSLEHRAVAVLVQRESRHLDEPARADVDRRRSAVVDRMAGLLRAARPELDVPDATFLASSALSVLGSPSYHGVVVPRATGEALTREMATAVLAAQPSPLADVTVAVASDAPSAGSRASRREAILAAAVTLFAERGFSSVRMEDVGTAAGIAGPSIYEHFESKADLLMAALTRGAEWLQFGISRALATGTSPAETLELVLRSYVEFTLQHTDLIHVLLTETLSLPTEERHTLRREQHEYVSEWVRLLTAVRPELSSTEARFVTHGVLAIVNDTLPGAASIGSGLEDRLVGLGLEAMLAGSEVVGRDRR